MSEKIISYRINVTIITAWETWVKSKLWKFFLAEKFLWDVLSVWLLSLWDSCVTCNPLTRCKLSESCMQAAVSSFSSLPSHLSPGTVCGHIACFLTMLPCRLVDMVILAWPGVRPIGWCDSWNLSITLCLVSTISAGSSQNKRILPV